MHGFVELLGVGVQRDADVCVPGDLRHPYRVEAKSDDEMRDERPSQIVSCHRRLPAAVQTCLFSGRDDSSVSDVMAIHGSTRCGRE